MITLLVLETLIIFQLRFQQNPQQNMWNLLFPMVNVQTAGEVTVLCWGKFQTLRHDFNMIHG